MAKSVFQKGKEKAARRKEFLKKGKGYGLTTETGPRPTKTETLRMKQLEETQPKKAQPKSIFQKGREKKVRRAKFLKEARERGAGAVRRTKPRPKAKRGRAVKDDFTKAQLFVKAKEIKKRDGRKEPVSYYNKLQLRRYVLKYE